MIYFLRIGPEGPVKIGWTANLKQRLKSLGYRERVYCELLRRGWVRHGVVVTHGIAMLRRSAWQITELGRQQIEKDNGHE